MIFMAQAQLQPTLNVRIPPAQPFCIAPSAAHMKLLGGLNPIQKTEPARTIDVKESKGLKCICEAYEKFGAIKYPLRDVEGTYSRALRHVHALDYTAQDVTAFPLTLAEQYSNLDEDQDGLGMFISALVNNSKEQDFTIALPHLIVGHIGYKNSKNLTIIGDVGPRAGRGMQSGNLTIRGNANDNVGDVMLGGHLIVFGNARNHIADGMKGGNLTITGSVAMGAGSNMHGGMLTIGKNAGTLLGVGMYGGEIIVKGSVGNRAGSQMVEGKITIHKNTGEQLGEVMKGGEIIVHGKAGEYAGHAMRGGIIYLNGTYVSIAPTTYMGKIYHKGKLKVDGIKRDLP